MEYTIERSRRRTLAIQMKTDGTWVVKAPLRTKDRDIRTFVQSKADWIRRTEEKARRTAQEAKAAGMLSQADIRKLAAQAKKVIPERVSYYAPLVGVSYGRITIRSQRSRWGSCSAKGNLNFNCLLMLTPPEVIDSVVVHELCHRKEMNHSRDFYGEVLRVFPEYRTWEKWLKKNGEVLMKRAFGSALSEDRELKVDGGFCFEDRGTSPVSKKQDRGTSPVLILGTAIMDCMIRGFQPEPISRTGYVADFIGLYPGGEGINQAVTMAALGKKPALCTFVGNDGAGLLMTEYAKSRGICLLPVNNGGGSTPVTTMFIAEDGNRKSITCAAHREDWLPQAADLPLEGVKVLSVASLFRAPFLDPGKLLPILKKAKDLGLIVCADTKLPNYRKLTPEDYREVLPYVDYLTPNEDEAFYCTQTGDLQRQAEIFLSYGVKNVIIKRGAKGCFFKNETEEYTIPACDVNVVDATGAGDAFLAAYICALLDGSGHEEALVYATKIAGKCTTCVGATGWLK